MATRDAVFPDRPHALYALHRYSPAVREQGLLFVSGQVGAREDGSPEPDAELQIRRAFNNLNAVLAGAGCTFEDVVDVMMFFVDPEADVPIALKVMEDYWGGPPHPTLTAVGVTWLAGFRFEIKVVARLQLKASGSRDSG
jgi:enamine deaminase RidA (YjgF/YER057c/UK114 family)